MGRTGRRSHTCMVAMAFRPARATGAAGRVHLRALPPRPGVRGGQISVGEPPLAKAHHRDAQIRSGGLEKPGCTHRARAGSRVRFGRAGLGAGSRGTAGTRRRSLGTRMGSTVIVRDGPGNVSTGTRRGVLPRADIDFSTPNSAARGSAASPPPPCGPPPPPPARVPAAPSGCFGCRSCKAAPRVPRRSEARQSGSRSRY